MTKTFGATAITTVLGDLTKQPDLDVIVNAANTALMMGAGVCGAIFRAAGWEELQEECYEYPYLEDGTRCQVGQAVHTGPHHLPNKGVIHAVGPIYNPGDAEVEDLLASAYYQSLALADERGYQSIGFPAISCGVYRYPWDEAAQVALGVCSGYSTDGSQIKEIRFVFIPTEEGRQLMAEFDAVLAAL